MAQTRRTQRTQQSPAVAAASGPSQPQQTSQGEQPQNAAQPTQGLLSRWRLPVAPPPPRMSPWSSAQVPDSMWADTNLLLGAGMVVLQPATSKIVVVYESKKKYWFLPKGRKDVGESLEQAALREAHEESGYRVEFLPLHTHSRAPLPPNTPTRDLNSEPIYITTQAFAARTRNNRSAPPGEYLTFWYVGQIPADAVREEGTGMPDEVNYEAHLLSLDEAVGRLDSVEGAIVQYAWETAQRTLKIIRQDRAEAERLERQRLRAGSGFRARSSSA
ncbi:NUDIX hydrolase domain-like protein [Mycena alexandri]|uniref:NUDIX hydrolase domain-like protein n=1 Tax=Mycena alexandri TaxID=1745969 RepID=A0AAD6TBM2_9AGAR|nr:NUDIX hydrolase domain-like protein [Mycena alexandri]